MAGPASLLTTSSPVMTKTLIDDEVF
jgi:hypothetical protein